MKALKCRGALLCVTAAIAISRSVATATIYNSPPDAIPNSLQSGDVLNITDAFQVVFLQSAEAGSIINLSSGGGIFAANVRGVLNSFPDAAGMASGSIDGGTVYAWGGSFGMPSMSNGATFNIEGADVLSLTSYGGTVNFRSGVFQNGSLILNTTVNLFATTGSAGAGEFHIGDSVFNFCGGELTPTAGSSLNSGVGAEIHLFMQSAALNGAPIPGLALGATVVIPQRLVTLGGVMKDGSPVDMYLGNFATNQKFQFADGSTLKVTMVPEPASSALAYFGLAMSGRRRRTVART